MEALELLKKMYSAPQTLNYQGTFVYSHDGKIESMKIFHSVGAEGERERLFHLNGSAREVVREQNVVTCVLSDNKSVMVNKSRGDENVFLSLPENFDSLKNYYSFVLGDDDRIAGRHTKTVLVNPKDDFRYGHKLWIDAETGLLLSSELFNEQNRTVERIMFTELEIVDKISNDLLKPTVSGEKFTWHKDMADEGVAEPGASSWAVTNMPEGFSASRHHVRHESNKSNSIEHIVLSDGLASVSIYVERLVEENSKFIGASFMGAVNVYGAVVDDHQITVVGEVPKATVKMIASSVENVDLF